MKDRVRLLALGLVAVVQAGLVHGDDEVGASRSARVPAALFAQYGRATDTSSFTLGAHWHFSRGHWDLGCGLLTSHGEVELGRWQADDTRGHAYSTQIGFTPALRYWPAGTMTGWFVEGGIGANVISPHYHTAHKRFSTTFNFGDHLAVGYRPKSLQSWEWSLRFQHFSNADIEKPNPGADFVQLRLGLLLD